MVSSVSFVCFLVISLASWCDAATFQGEGNNTENYAPLATLQLGSNINPNLIKEGVDVYFECNVKANPPVYKISWRHNGVPLVHDLVAGTVMSNQSLVLQKVSRARAGLYSCVGTNREGDGESNPVTLDVKK